MPFGGKEPPYLHRTMLYSEMHGKKRSKKEPVLKPAPLCLDCFLPRVKRGKNSRSAVYSPLVFTSAMVSNTYLPSWQSLLPLKDVKSSSMLIGSLKSHSQPWRQTSKLPAWRSFTNVAQSTVWMVMLMPMAARSC